MSISIPLQPRASQQTKKQLSDLRKSGWIPAVVYGHDKPPVNISVCTKFFLKQLETPGVRTRTFEVAEGVTALVKEMQFRPTKDTPIHIDFLRLGERVVVSVPLHFVHEDMSPGIKRGGVLNVIHYTLNISVLSVDIPHEILVDLTGVDIGQTLHLKDLNLPKDAHALHVDDDEAIVSVVAPSGLTESLKDS